MNSKGPLLRGLACLALACQPLSAAEPLVTEAIINAPLATVWQAFATADGYATVGIAGAKVDLQLGGLVEVPAGPGKTTSAILSFEPERLLATRVTQAPAEFGPASDFATTWTLVYFTSLGEMTQVRVAGFGFTTPLLARFFEQDQSAQLKRLEKLYWPLCALCKKTGS